MWKNKVLSPAKINLHLDVAPPDDSGFHPLRSLFLQVSLYDEMIVEESKEGCEIISDFPLPPQANILYKCWEMCREENLYGGGLKIHLKKNIPSGAGLGGGSGNGASLIKILSGLHPDLSRASSWRDIASRLGSDVPFFLEGPAALVTGRGEHVEPVTPRTDFRVLIVYPELFISTPAAFSGLDRMREGNKERHSWSWETEEIGHVFREDAPRDWPFFNSFTSWAYKEYPLLAEIDETLLTLGADFVSLSGSGSAMVGIFTDYDALVTAEKEMKVKFPSTYALSPLDIIPYGIVK